MFLKPFLHVTLDYFKIDLNILRRVAGKEGSDKRWDGVKDEKLQHYWIQ